MRVTVRDGFYSGLGIALLCGLFLIWLWQPKRQVRRHTEKLFDRIEAKDWSAVADLIDSDYRDQWSQNRSNVVERMRAVVNYARGMRIATTEPAIKIDNGRAFWFAKITIEGDSEALTLIKERINSIPTPFELQWCRISRKPWDWRLFRVSNAELQLPSDFE